MEHYYYRCFDCGGHVAARELEGNLGYLCPDCGSAEENQPLKGVLLVEYDYGELKTRLDRGRFLTHRCGEFWRYPQLWPLAFGYVNGSMEDFANGQATGTAVGQTMIQMVPGRHLCRLAMNPRPLLEYHLNIGRVMVFDDTRNPTLSSKDRASVIVALKALQLGFKRVATASTGNAGSSLAGICARLGLEAHVFVPASIPTAKRLQIQSAGADIYLVQGDYARAFQLCREIAEKKGWYNRNTAYNPLTIEGKKSIAYDIFIASKGKLPEIIFVPVGDGVIISGVYKGFRELKQLGWIEKIPRLMAVQAQGSPALVDYLDTGEFHYRHCSTIADSICAGDPSNLYMAARAIRATDGGALGVSDEEILHAQQTTAQKLGLLVEPAAAASWAGYQKLRREEELGNTPVLLLMTGNGLKDTDALGLWNPTPGALTVDEWREVLAVR